MDVAGNVALVTGGASGLGRATGEALAAAGAHLVLVDLPGSDGEVVAGRLGGGARFVAADVTDEAQVREAVELAVSLGPLRVVVSCAGIVQAKRLVGRDGLMPLAGFEQVVRVNLLGTATVMGVAAEAMQSVPQLGEERGVVVNTASVAAFDGQIGQTAYAASKGAVASLTLPAARELAASRIRVMAIAPGTFETPMMAGLSEEVRDSLAAQVPHPCRLGRPAEYAALVRHIVENPMLNGEVIRLDGAIRMGPR
ncbi:MULTISPECIES: SDR family NAD(P)-dependent oxidoreductase [Brachybacterium]|uniref:3-hydroxyacyl-CoA dehydrogenase n=2 Tax=Brachybacterium TaxID=43668 RepID=A0A426SMS3_9MICO|nr:MULTISPECIES: SDR family NAD(P)-dependent oxidoreductase [Brachybacterium]RRR19469.1 3-hydroxyacyl-CoA dehydrogenase [Brachybacterium paraconglomeratum]GLI31119.1 3-hydroxyacyl-CoA dehydrogenase [Brachybacterium conglomeratum]GLK04031.1 3-hydroxyacyl-CoA dehydrogenase [Brachybacterium conglomeratum]